MAFHFRLILRIFTYVLMGIAASLLPSLFIAVFFQETAEISAFGCSVLLSFLIGAFLWIRTNRWFPKKDIRETLNVRDKLFLASGTWLLVSALGSVPYLLSGTVPHWGDAFFESASAFTTTGATALGGIEFLPKSILFFRSISGWLGGLGILLLSISFFPSLGINAVSVSGNETVGSDLKKRFAPFADSHLIKIIPAIYCSLTAVCFLSLKLSGLTASDAFFYALGTISTSGLTTSDAGISSLHNPVAEWILCTFMLFAAINYILYLKNSNFRRLQTKIKNTELYIYFGMILGASVLTALCTFRSSSSTLAVSQTLRDAFFQTLSVITTTGYQTSDPGLLPEPCHMLLFLLAFIGGCSASPAGGIKIIRTILLFRVVRLGIDRKLHTSAVTSVKFGKETLSADAAPALAGFYTLFFFLFLLGTLLTALDCRDLVTAASVSVTCLSNLGAGCSLLAPGCCFASFSAPLKIYLALQMIAGRLEITAVLLLFFPSFWRVTH